MEALVRTNVPTTTQTIFGRSAGISDLIDINGTTPGTIRLNLLTSAGQVNINTAGVFSMDTNIHHVLCTFDATTGIGTIYVDGVARIASGNIGACTLSNTTTWKIGALADTTRNMNGSIYGVRLWNRVLTAAEVMTMASRPASPVQSGSIIGDWKMLDGSGSQVTDSSGSGYHGTIAGGVTWAGQMLTKSATKALTDGLPTAGLVARYRMDELSGTTLKDLSGRGNDATFKIQAVAYYPFNGNANDFSNSAKNGTIVGGVQLVADRFGNANGAVKFSGGAGTDYITTPIAPATDQVRTVVVVYRLTDGTLSNESFFNGPGLSWMKQGTNDWQVYMTNGATSYRFRNISPNADGNVHVEVFSFDQTTNKLNWYRDGALITGNITSDFTSTPSGTVNIGAYAGAQSLAGTIDEIMFLPYTISAGHVTNLYALLSTHKWNDPMAAGGKFGKIADVWGQGAAASNSPGSYFLNTAGISNSIQGASKFTVSYWIKVPSANSDGNYIGWYGGNYKGPYFSAQVGQVGYTLGRGNTLGSNQNAGASFSAPSIVANTLAHIAWVYDGTNLIAYVNNVVVGTFNAGVFVDNGSGGQNFKINGNPWDNNMLGTSKYDEVMVYNRALSAVEIGQVYALTNPETEVLAKGYTTAKSDVFTLAESVIRSIGKAISDKVYSSPWLSFDGSLSYAQSSSMMTSIGSAFSVNAFIYPTTVKQAQVVATTGDGQVSGLYLQTLANGALRLKIGNGTVAATYDSTTGLITANNAYNVGVVYNAGTITFYVNGTPYTGTLSSGTAISGTIADSTFNTTIGRHVVSGSYQFQGGIRGVRIWKSALTATDMQNLASEASTPSGMYLEYKMREFTGNTLIDTSGSGINATVTSSTGWTLAVPYSALESITKSIKPVRADVIMNNDGNLVTNGTLSYVPQGSTPQTTGSRWLNGTATGGAVGSPSETNIFAYMTGGSSVVIDKTQGPTADSPYSIKAVMAAGGYTEIRFGATTYYKPEGMLLAPNTTYTYSIWMQAEGVTGTSSNGQSVLLILNDAYGNPMQQPMLTAVNLGNLPWTNYTGTFTTGSKSVIGHLEPRVYGHTGAATLAGTFRFGKMEIYKQGTSDSSFMVIAINKILTDTVSIIEVLAKLMTRSIGLDTIFISDTLAKQSARVFTETFTIVEKFIRRIYPYLERIKVYTAKASPFKRFPKK